MKNSRLTIFLALLLLVGYFSSTPASMAASIEPTFCYEWLHYGDEPNAAPVTENQRFMFHLGFFLTQSDRVRGQIEQQTHLDKLTLDKVMACYEENTPLVVEAIDAVCGKQANDKQIKNIINGYITWCIQQTNKSV